MKACIHNKYGNVILSTAIGEQVHWCRNCGALYSVTGGWTEATPMREQERVAPSRKAKSGGEMFEEKPEAGLQYD